MAGGDRKPADSALVAALAAGATRAAAAELAGVSESTVYRRLADASFRDQVQQARSDMVDQVAGRLVYLSTSAVETMGRLLKARSENVQLQAARALLENSATYRKNEELEQRVAAIEAQLEQRVEPRGGRPWAA